MLVYAIRHAESLANVGRDASLNSGLSPLGMQQATALARRFEKAAVTAILSSPFLRCLQTAIPIAGRLGLPVRVHPHLSEFHNLPAGTHRDLGVGEIDAICRQHPSVEPCPDYSGSWDWPAADEPLEEMIRRVQTMAGWLKSRCSGSKDVVVLVSHGSPIARLIEAWLIDRPGPSFRFTIDNATVAALRCVQGVSSLVCLNETSHLRELPVSPRANYSEDGSIKPEPASSYW